MQKPYGFERAARREIVRLMLEKTQSMDMSRMMDMMGSKEPVEYDDVEETLNVPYVNRDEIPLAMDVFKPDVPEGKELPVIIMIHGGGLVMGDRGLARAFCRRVAHLNYLVFSLEYRLAPKANVCQQLDDVCAGMDLVGKMLVDYNVDLTRIFLVADSAGAYLATYVSAMIHSVKLQQAIGYEPTHMRFAAIGLMSGLFYMNRKDPTGFMLADQVYGDKGADEKFLKFMDPENPEIVDNLPPVFLITSRGDFMNNYTFMFHKALRKACRTTHLLYYADDSLQHVFAIKDPEAPKSVDAVDKMLAWFEEQASAKTKKHKKNSTVSRRIKKIENRIADGSISDQKVWSLLKEIRSADPEKLKDTAIIDCTREYTYEQMFEEWDKYAKVFTALGITSENKSRTAIAGAITAEPLFAFYALNMTGSEVSMFSYPDFVPGGTWRSMLEREKITDLIISDIMVTKDLLAELEKAKEELGIRNIIFLHSKMGGPAVGPAELVFNEVNYHMLERTKGVVFMDELIAKYADTEIFIDNSDSDEIAVITHTSGTTKGMKKPLPYSNRSMNVIATRPSVGKIIMEEAKKPDQHFRSLIHFDFSSFLSIGGAVNTSFAKGETIVLTFFGFMHPKFIRAADYYSVQNLALGGFIIDRWLDRPDLDDVNLASVKTVMVGGSYLTPDKMKRYKEFLEDHGCDCDIYTGYGMSEAGGTELVVRYSDGEDIIGNASECDGFLRIKDENDGGFYLASDGPRTGIMYLTSDSMCKNELDGEVLFDFTEIDGVNYICTNDLVRVNDDGTISYGGRADKYFTNNEGKKYDSGKVEVQMSLHPNIDRCSIVPVLEKRIHDTVPVLYAVPADKETDSAESIRQALVDVYVKDRKLSEGDLPVQFMIVDDIPLNSNGKKDIFRITRERLKGKSYNVIPVKEDDELVDISIEYADNVNTMTAGTVPEGVGAASAFNIFDVFNTVPAKKTASASRRRAPFPVMFNFAGFAPGSDEPHIQIPDALIKMGNKMVGKLYSAKDYDFDIDE